MSTTTLEKSQMFSRSGEGTSVSKLERLNARVGRLLAAAVREVLEAVRETVGEYQERAARTQRENERLRVRLSDALEALQKEREASRRASISLPADCFSSQSVLVLEAPDGPHLGRSSSPSWSKDQAVKVEDGVREPGQGVETEVCDVKVALTLADGRADRDIGEAQCDSDSHAPELAASHVKTEPTGADGSSEQLRVCQAGFGALGGASCGPPLPRSIPGALLRRGGGSRPGPRPPGPQGEGSHVCQACGKTFSRIGNLRTHQRCHTGERPYRCLACGRGFSQAGDLKKHKRVHTGEKPYYCVQCGKSFSRGENLKRHQKIHIGELLRRQHSWRDPQGVAT